MACIRFYPYLGLCNFIRAIWYDVNRKSIPLKPQIATTFRCLLTNKFYSFLFCGYVRCKIVTLMQSFVYKRYKLYKWYWKAYQGLNQYLKGKYNFAERYKIKIKDLLGKGFKTHSIKLHMPSQYTQSNHLILQHFNKQPNDKQRTQLWFDYGSTVCCGHS